MKQILLAFLLSGPFLASGQEKKFTIRPGLKAGMALSSVGPGQTDNDGHSHSYRMTGGTRFGGFLHITVGKTVVIQPEVLMVVKGAREQTEYQNGNPSSDYPVHINYFEIPLNILIRLRSGQGFFLLGGGPAPSFSTNKYASFAAKFDMGLNLLMSYRWPIGFSIDLNYTKGLNQITPYYPPGLKLKNNSLGLSIGYTF
jgi:hypothetical protein